MASPQRPLFPFAALRGQQALQTALLLAAIDPQLGGVLIQGPRGTAKSTSARALAELLPQGHFVNLPLGASEEQLVGTLNIEAALKTGDVQFRPGLLARAHLGVLYVDEVNLLADTLVDLLLDVSASGINVIERDGISHQHDARFVVVGTMNPEEGELRPQLLDRFGLFVSLDAAIAPELRQQIVQARLQFDADPAAFAQQLQPQQAALKQRIVAAQAALSQLPFTDAIHRQVSELCCAAQVEGVRADLVLLRAARAHAALQAQDHIEAHNIEAVAEWALAHRRKADVAAAPQPPRENRHDDSRNQDRHSGEQDSADDWTVLLPENVPIQALKSVRPLPLKKS